MGKGRGRGGFRLIKVQSRRAKEYNTTADALCFAFRGWAGLSGGQAAVRGRSIHAREPTKQVFAMKKNEEHVVVFTSKATDCEHTYIVGRDAKF